MTDSHFMDAIRILHARVSQLEHMNSSAGDKEIVLYHAQRDWHLPIETRKRMKEIHNMFANMLSYGEVYVPPHKREGFVPIFHKGETEPVFDKSPMWKQHRESRRKHIPSKDYEEIIQPSEEDSGDIEPNPGYNAYPNPLPEDNPPREFEGEDRYSNEPPSGVLVPNKYEQKHIEKYDRVYSRKAVEEMNRQYNEYWKLLTRRDIHFVFYVDNQRYLSVSAPSRHVWAFVNRFFVRRPIILDSSAGVGGDAVCMLFDTCPHRLIMVEKNDAETRGRGRSTFRTLQENIRNFILAFPEYSSVSLMFENSLAQAFLRYTAHMVIDCIFCDPPWFGDGYTAIESRPTMEFLQNEIFKIVAERMIDVVMYVIKARFSQKVMEGFIPEFLPGYKLVASIYATPFKNTYCYHVIVNTTTQHLRWQPDELFEYVYSNHHRGKPPVNKDGQPSHVAPITPDSYYHFPPNMPAPFKTYNPQKAK